jgi:ATP-binding cassette subfamily A (ABC1) protein 3
MFGPCFIAFTYLMSFLFKGPSSAQVFTFILSLFTGFILMIASNVMRIIPNTREIQLNFTEYIFRLFPMFDYCFGMASLANGIFWQFVFELDEPPKVWGKYGMLKEAIAMPLMTIVYFALIFFIEFRKGKVNVEKKNTTHDANELGEHLLPKDPENPNPDNLEEEVLKEI